MIKYLTDDFVDKELILAVIDSVDKALNDDSDKYKGEFNTYTSNGLSHCVGDWINTNLKKALSDKRTQKFRRYFWTGNLIIDDERKVIYNVANEDRIKQLKNEKREYPHYLQSLSGTLNRKIKSDGIQIGFIDPVVSFDSETLKDDTQKILNEDISKYCDYSFCVIGYAKNGNFIRGIKVFLMNETLDVIESKDYSNLIKPDYALIKTSTEHNKKSSVEDKKDIELVQLKKKEKVNTLSNK